MKAIINFLVAIVLVAFCAMHAAAAATSSAEWQGGLAGQRFIIIDVTNVGGATDTYTLPAAANNYLGRVLYELSVYSPDDVDITLTLATDPDGDSSWSNVLVTGTTVSATSGEKISTGNRLLLEEARISISGLDDGETARVYITVY